MVEYISEATTEQQLMIKLIFEDGVVRLVATDEKGTEYNVLGLTAKGRLDLYRGIPNIGLDVDENGEICLA